MSKPKLTYDEFKKASAAGMITGSACCCMGPQGSNEFCPCAMNMLDILTPDGAELLAQEWRDRKAKQIEERKPKIETIRDKRLARMKELGIGS